MKESERYATAEWVEQQRKAPLCAFQSVPRGAPLHQCQIVPRIEWCQGRRVTSRINGPAWVNRRISRSGGLARLRLPVELSG
jgi:hypothetical protein